MRLLRFFGTALFVAITAGAISQARAPMPEGKAADAVSILAAARDALGGEKRLGAVASFVAKGRTRQVRGNNLVPIEFEILCQLPDKYLRKDEIPAQESEPTTSGFNGEALIQIPAPPAMPAAPRMPTPPVPATATAAPAGPAGRGGPPAIAGPPVDPRKARVVSLKQDFARLTLGMFAASFSSYPLTFTHVGQAEAPQGKADVLEVRGEGGFLLKFFINSDTHLPIMVSWFLPATTAVVTVPGQPAPDSLPPGAIVVQAPAPPAPGAPKEELERYQKEVQDIRRKALAGRLIEHRLYYAEYRDIGSGIKFPFRLRRATGADTTEETNFDGFDINRRIDPRRFEPLK